MSGRDGANGATNQAEKRAHGVKLRAAVVGLASRRSVRRTFPVFSWAVPRFVAAVV